MSKVCQPYAKGYCLTLIQQAAQNETLLQEVGHPHWMTSGQ